jgi:hypothetical protein
MRVANSQQLVVDATAWDVFCDVLFRTGDVIMRDGSP